MVAIGHPVASRQSAFLQRTNYSSVQRGLVECDCRMPGHAELAAVGTGCRDLYHFAFGQRQAAAAVDFGDSQVGLKGGGRIGQCGNQIGQVAVVGDYALNEW